MRWAPVIILYLREKVWRNSGGHAFSLNDACLAFIEKFPEDKLAKNQLRGYEIGTHTPRADMVANLAALYEVPIQCLFAADSEEFGDIDSIRTHLIKHGVLEDS